jgi:hypothetical protein
MNQLDLSSPQHRLLSIRLPDEVQVSVPERPDLASLLPNLCIPSIMHIPMYPIPRQSEHFARLKTPR